MSRHRSLLIGCGNRGQTHARALADSDEFDFAAVCDHDVEQASATAEKYDVSAVYDDHVDALVEENPDHVTAVTAPSVRSSLLADILSHEPASLLFEKPVANTLDEVEDIAALAAESDTLVTVSHQKIYADEFRAIKGWIEEGEIGDLGKLIATTKGGLTGQGTHLIHALNWLVGARPNSIRAFAEGGIGLDPARNPSVPGHAEPEDTVIELSYPDSVRAFVHLGPSAPDVPAQADTFWYEFEIDAVGSDGIVEAVLGDHAAIVSASGREHVDARGFDEDAYMTRSVYDDIDAVLGNDLERHPTDLASAVDVHRVVDAAMRAALDGRAVSFAEQPPAVGRPTPERLRRFLLSRQPISVSSLLYRDRPRKEAFEALADLGVTAVDMWTFSEFATHLDPGTDSVSGVRAELDRYGLSVPTVTFFDQEPVEETLSFAAELGAETAVTFGRTPKRPNTWDRDTITRWLDHAADLGMTISFENHFDYMETVEETEAMLRALDHPAARVALSPPHLWHAGGQRAEEALARLGDEIEILYLWDTDPGTDAAGSVPWWQRPDDQVPGGGGVVDFERLLDAAIEHAPEAHWTLCYHGTDGWSDDRITRSIARAMRTIESSRP
ncbi:TIM barrel protein [Haladaptatus sp. CMAA 1911]|uniref:TIM barrel protein n=1 Tax=unclassified Haladaptatus TaxID=2622732 RepID=UPI0037545113